LIGQQEKSEIKFCTTLVHKSNCFHSYTDRLLSTISIKTLTVRFGFDIWIYRFSPENWILVTNVLNYKRKVCIDINLNIPLSLFANPNGNPEKLFFVRTYRVVGTKRQIIIFLSAWYFVSIRWAIPTSLLAKTWSNSQV